MLTEVARGSTPAIIGFVLLISGAYINYYISTLGLVWLAGWLLFSSIRLLHAALKGSNRSKYDVEIEVFVYWLWAVWSSLLAFAIFIAMFAFDHWIDHRTTGSLLLLAVVAVATVCITVGAVFLDPTTRFQRAKRQFQTTE
jgi:hypothetical protein